MKQDPGPLNCPSCGKELYDNGEERFSCPYCGADVVTPRLTAQETPEKRCQRLERELARERVKAQIETLGATDHFWTRGNPLSMLERQSARQALERGDIDAAKAHLVKADRSFSIGCLAVVIACIVFALLAMFAR